MKVNYLTDFILKRIPTAHAIKEGLAKGMEAAVWFDDSGRLNIAINGVGVILIDDDTLLNHGMYADF